MNLKRKTDGTAMTVTVAGRIDTATAPEFEQGVKPYLGNITELKGADGKTVIDPLPVQE